MSKDKDEREEEEEEVEDRDKRLRKKATELQVKLLEQVRDILSQYKTVEDMPPDIREEFEQLYHTFMTNDKIRKVIA
jgi:DNA polymerase II small subunit/DNA polymerase delta subunit B